MCMCASWCQGWMHDGEFDHGCQRRVRKFRIGPEATCEETHHESAHRPAAQGTPTLIGRHAVTSLGLRAKAKRVNSQAWSMCEARQQHLGQGAYRPETYTSRVVHTHEGLRDLSIPAAVVDALLAIAGGTSRGLESSTDGVTPQQVGGPIGQGLRRKVGCRDPWSPAADQRKAPWNHQVSRAHHRRTCREA